MNVSAKVTGQRRVWGRRLHYVARGNGPTVLALHGLGAASHVWDGLSLPGFRLVAVDLPGSGWSEPRPGRLVLRELAELLDDFVQAAFPGPYAVVGHSMGALVALELALDHPGVQAAALVDAPVRLPPVARLSSAPLVGDALFRLSALAPLNRRAVALYLSFLFGDRRKVTPPRVDAYLRTAAMPGYPASVLRGLRGIAQWAHGGRLSSLKVPCAVIWGERDRLLPLALGRRLAESLPDASFHALPGCGHSPPEECPDALARVLLPFLERALAPPAKAPHARNATS